MNASLIKPGTPNSVIAVLIDVVDSGQKGFKAEFTDVLVSS